MSGCALRRWGTGHSTYRPETAAAKEVEGKLASMMRERERQDCMWGGAVEGSGAEQVKRTTDPERVGTRPTPPSAARRTSADNSHPSLFSSRTSSNAPFSR
jgi:hypothetical protein